ncbi:unnamed protein product, partial [Porites evermanni]
MPLACGFVYTSSMQYSLQMMKGRRHIYVKKIIQQYSDSAGLLTPGLRTPEERVQFLRNIPTAFNFMLEAPLRNLKTQADAEKEYPEEFQAFFDNYEPLRKER